MSGLNPSEYKYTESHEWLAVAPAEGGYVITVGITDFAQQSLGDVVYLELPEVGEDISKGDEVAVIESVKAAGEINSPIDGEVIEVNEPLAESPETVNEDALGAGWIFKLKVSSLEQLEGLMSESEYQSHAE
jgi:glycine cleavage system H protein